MTTPRLPRGSDHFARALRLRRLHRSPSDRLMIVPLDHSIGSGPLLPRGSVDTLVGQLAGNGVDAVVVHKGTARRLQPRWFRDLALVVHLSASTVHAPDPDAKYLVTGVEEALRLGADAVSVHVNLGSAQEARQVADLGAVADACDRWNMPLMAMVYPRGPHVRDARDPALVAHAAVLAADLGADIVKTPFPGTADEMADVTAASPIPVVVAGGPQVGSQEQLHEFVAAALAGGAAGVAMGRNVFQAADPAAVARGIGALVHAAGGPALVGQLGALPPAS